MRTFPAHLAQAVLPGLFSDQPARPGAARRTAAAGRVDRHEPHDHQSHRREAPAAREIPLKALQDRDGHFTAWRGRSGRRYVVSRYELDDAAALGFVDAVLLAVGPDRTLIDVRESGPWGVEAALEGWREAMRAAGAVALHVHVIAETAAARAAAVADLRPLN